MLSVECGASFKFEELAGLTIGFLSLSYNFNSFI
jgi:hypothetical protein